LDAKVEVSKELEQSKMSGLSIRESTELTASSPTGHPRYNAIELLKMHAKAQNSQSELRKTFAQFDNIIAKKSTAQFMSSREMVFEAKR